VSLDFRTGGGASYFGGVGGYSDGTNYVAGLWGGAAASGAPDLVVNSSGNVGIGTTNPSQKLDVIGNIKGSQSITIGTGGLYEAGSIYSDSNWGMIFRAKQASPGQADFRWANSADTERMRIDTSGNVLIGTTTAPGSLRMAVLGGGVQFSGGTSAQEGLRFQRASGYASITGINNDNNTFNAISFFTSGTSALHIATGNKVGIGTTAPAVKLEVSNGSTTGTALQVSTTGSGHNFDMVDSTGTARFRNVNGEMRLYGDLLTGGNGNIIFAPQGTTERMRITSSGNVGIGGSETTVFNGVGGDMKFVVIGDDSATNIANNSDAGIAVVNTNQTAGNLAGLHFARADTDNSPNYAGASIVAQFPDAQVTGQYPKGDLAFLTSTAANSAPSEKMRIISSGSVGIGTASPDSGTPLHVQESSASLGANTTASALLIERAGNVGMTLGTANTGTASIFFGDQNSLTTGRLQYDNNDNSLQFWANSIERMRISSAGNVGIGTSSPGGFYKLEVNGNIGGPSANFVIYPSPGVSARRTLSLSNNANATLHLDHDGGYNRFGCDNTSQHFAFCAGGSTAGDINVVFKGDGNVGIGTTSPAKQLHITKASKADIGLLTDGATITPDFDAKQNFIVTLGGNRTLANPTNADGGQTGSIFVVQDATGGRTLSFGANWKFAGGTAPTLSTGANAVDRIDYIVKSSTEIQAVASLNLS
jgi:hypothetical protein